MVSVKKQYGHAEWISVLRRTEGGLVGGFYEQGSHRIVDMDACLIQDPQNDELIRQVKRIAIA